MKRKNMTKFDKAVSAAFTGHRFYNFSQQEVIRERLTKAILEAYEHGISNFILLLSAKTPKRIKTLPEVL